MFSSLSPLEDETAAEWEGEKEGRSEGGEERLGVLAKMSWCNVSIIR
jgi:hypothetical protein